MRGNEFTPKIVSNIKTTAGKSPMSVLLMTPRGEKLGIDGVHLPISAFSKLVETLHASHLVELCHVDVCPDNMFAVKIKGTEQYYVLLNDWGSSMTFQEVSSAEKFCTHVLFYEVEKMGAGQDLAALVRSVFFLTHATFSSVETVVELDMHMHQQHWGHVLNSALSCDYKAVELFLLDVPRKHDYSDAETFNSLRLEKDPSIYDRGIRCFDAAEDGYAVISEHENPKYAKKKRSEDKARDQRLLRNASLQSASSYFDDEEVETGDILRVKAAVNELEPLLDGDDYTEDGHEVEKMRKIKSLWKIPRSPLPELFRTDRGHRTVWETENPSVNLWSGLIDQTCSCIFGKQQRKCLYSLVYS
jgi:hypothetical protein